MPERVCPRCPVCDSEPVLDLGGQAFCGNSDCQALTWNPNVPAATQLLDAHYIDLKDKPR